MLGDLSSCHDFLLLFIQPLALDNQKAQTGLEKATGDTGYELAKLTMYKIPDSTFIKDGTIE